MAAYLSSPVESSWKRLGATVTQIGDGWRMPESFAGVHRETECARQALVIADETPRGKILLQGEQGGRVARMAFGAAPTRVGEMVCSEDVEIVCLRPDLHHVGTLSAELKQRITALQAVCEGACTLTDVTHGRFELCMIGPLSAQLLSKVCGLDFDSSQFPEGTAHVTSVAKTKQLIIHTRLGELPAYRLIGGRALGAYVWDTLMEAGQELGVEPIGTTALRTLAE